MVNNEGNEFKNDRVMVSRAFAPPRSPARPGRKCALHRVKRPPPPFGSEISLSALTFFTGHRKFGVMNPTLLLAVGLIVPPHNDYPYGVAWNPTATVFIGVATGPDGKAEACFERGNPADWRSRQELLSLGEGQSQSGLEVERIDRAAGRVIGSLNHARMVWTWAAGTNAHPAGGVSAGGVTLRGVHLSTALERYAAAAGRTVVAAPDLPAAVLDLQAPPESAAAAAERWLAALAGAGVSLLPDGTKFMVAVRTESAPAEQAYLARRAAVSPAAATVPSTPPEPMIAEGMVNLPRVSVVQALQLYSELRGRRLAEPLRWLLPEIQFRNSTPLTRGEAVHAFETMFRLRGIAIVDEGTNAFRVVRLPAAAHSK